MSRRSPILLLTILAVGVVWGQWVEDTVSLSYQPTALCYNPRRDKLYCVMAIGVAVISCWNNRVMRNVSAGGCTWTSDICYSSAEDKAYVLHFDGISVIDCWEDTVVAEIRRGLDGYIPSFCYASQANKVYALGLEGNTLAAIDCVTDTVVATVPLLSGSHSVCYNPANNCVYVSNQLSGRVQVVDCSADTQVARVWVGYRPLAMCANPVMNKVYCGNTYSGSVSVIDGETHLEVDTVVIGGAPTVLCYASGTNMVYVEGDSHKVWAIDCSTDDIAAGIDVQGATTGLIFNPVNNKVYAGCTRNIEDTVYVIDCETNTVCAKFDAACKRPIFFAHDTRGNQVYVGGSSARSLLVLRDSIPAGVGEEAPSPLAGLQLHVVSRGVLRLLGKQDAALLDITGRRVMSLKPGENDIRHVAHGVYFVRRSETEDGRPRTAVRKVVIQR